MEIALRNVNVRKSVNIWLLFSSSMRKGIECVKCLC